MKKSMGKACFSVICLFYVSIVSSQKNYSDAILIEIKNDTIHCKIKVTIQQLSKKT